VQGAEGALAVDRRAFNASARLYERLGEVHITRTARNVQGRFAHLVHLFGVAIPVEHQPQNGPVGTGCSRMEGCIPPAIRLIYFSAMVHQNFSYRHVGIFDSPVQRRVPGGVNHIRLFYGTGLVFLVQLDTRRDKPTGVWVAHQAENDVPRRRPR
jgi:hypothetical protein